MFVLLLDAATLGDPLFLGAFARDAAARGGGFVAVHSSGEDGERALEGLGAWPHLHEGVWQAGDRPVDTAQASAVERAARELNRRIVHELNEAGVSAVRATGADRGLLRGGDRRLEAGRLGWVEALARPGGVLVVASLVAGGPGGALREADPAAAAVAFAQALGVPVVVPASGRVAAVQGPDGGPLAEVALGALASASGVADAGTLARAVGHGADVRLVRRAALREPGVPSGSRIVPDPGS